MQCEPQSVKQHNVLTPGAGLPFFLLLAQGRNRSCSSIWAIPGMLWDDLQLLTKTRDC